jgi:membrane associated rhomboid family serine protease
VARLLRGVSGTIAFVGLYIVAGVIAALGYAWIHAGSGQAVWGASGAVFGLIGAATRLMGGYGRVLPLTDRRVLSASAAWMGVNLAIGLIGFAPGAGGAGIAWEAHAIGFVAGLIAIGPLGRVFGGAIARRDRLDDPPL